MISLQKMDSVKSENTKDSEKVAERLSDEPNELDKIFI